MSKYLIYLCFFIAIQLANFKISTATRDKFQNSIKLNGFCEDDNECKGRSTSCVDHICKCMPNFKPNPDLNDCSYFDCTTNTDCQTYDSNRICYQRKCICRNNTDEDLNNGHKCMASTEHMNTTTTKPLSNIGGECRTKKDCFGNNNVCLNGKCGCTLNYKQYANTSNCIRFNCMNNNQCATFDPNAFCLIEVMGVCSCKTGYKFNITEGLCKPITAEPLRPVNNLCGNDYQCAGQNTRCIGYVCKCVPNYSWNSTLHDCTYFSCEYNYQCRGFDPNYECSFGICRCPVGYTSYGYKCVQNIRTVAPPVITTKSKINEVCSNDNECMGMKTVCVNSLCKCSANYKPNTDMKECSYFQCAYNSDCQTYDYNRVCSSGLCVCSTDYTSDNINGGKCKYSHTYVWSFHSYNYGYYDYSWVWITVGIVIPLKVVLISYYIYRRRRTTVVSATTISSPIPTVAQNSYVNYK